MGNDRLSGKQVGSQASHRVTRRLACIQPVCISINAVPALKGLNIRVCVSQCLIRVELCDIWMVDGESSKEGAKKMHEKIEILHYNIYIVREYRIDMTLVVS